MQAFLLNPHIDSQKPIYVLSGVCWDASSRGTSRDVSWEPGWVDYRPRPNRWDPRSYADAPVFIPRKGYEAIVVRNETPLWYLRPLTFPDV